MAHGVPVGARTREGHALLEDSTVLVTGASSGIGEAIALAAAREGADVILTYRERELGARRVADAVIALGRRAATFKLDLADPAAIERLGRNAHDAFGRIDAWVNNAGADILTGSGAELSTRQKLDLLLSVDLRGTILASWAAVDLMRPQDGGGVIINMSWDHVLTGMPGKNPEMFAAVKGGVLAFSKSLARSVAPEVRVNVVAPGWIATAFAETLDAPRREEVARSTPLGRWGTPDDVARAVVWLASREASFHTGQVLLVNGGVVM
ncbi:MAG TPA: SDR family oxidoreductase [Gemmatimonadaceae bacterium]|nr:SDR family oxidoreductase [Gemmatimonadaceae bacterium]